MENERPLDSIQKQRIYHISDGNIPDGDNITVVLNNSEIYSGRFENGMMHGEGWIIQKVDGKIVFSIGRWENGIKCGKFLEITKENGRTVSKVINKWENGRCYTLKYIF